MTVVVAYPPSAILGALSLVSMVTTVLVELAQEAVPQFSVVKVRYSVSRGSWGSIVVIVVVSFSNYSTAKFSMIVVSGRLHPTRKK